MKVVLLGAPGAGAWVGWPAIVKIQLSLYPPGGGEVMFSNKGCSHAGIFSTPPALRQRMGDRVKVFFHAHVNELGEVELGEEAPWQSW